MAINTGSVTVTTTATLIIAGPDDFTSSRSVVVENTGASTVYLGAAGVTTATGKRLVSAATIRLDLDPGEDLYGIVAAATNTVDFIAT